MRSAVSEPTHLAGTDQGTQDGELPQLDSIDSTSARGRFDLTAVWAKSAGLLILYFTCVPPSKQVNYFC